MTRHPVHFLVAFIDAEMGGRCTKNGIISQSCTGYCVSQPLQPQQGLMRDRDHVKVVPVSHCFTRALSCTLGASLSSRWTQGMHSSLHSDTRSHSEWVSGVGLEPVTLSPGSWHTQRPDLILVFEALPHLSLTNSVALIKDSSTLGFDTCMNMCPVHREVMA